MGSIWSERAYCMTCDRGVTMSALACRHCVWQERDRQALTFCGAHGHRPWAPVEQQDTTNTRERGARQ